MKAHVLHKKMNPPLPVWEVKDDPSLRFLLPSWLPPSARLLNVLPPPPLIQFVKPPSPRAGSPARLSPPSLQFRPATHAITLLGKRRAKKRSFKEQLADDDDLSEEEQKKQLSRAL